MRQILLLILFFFASSWVARKLRQSQARAGRGSGPIPGAGGTPGYGGAAGRPRDSGALAIEPMVRCAECGVHAPKGEAFAAGGKFFCCADHAARHAAHAVHRDAQ